MHQQHTDPRIGLVLIGFSPPDRFRAVARHLEWPGKVFSDTDRVAYGLLGLGRAPLWRTYSPRTLLTYARAHRAGQRWSKPVEDTRQLGGDAVVVGGTVTDLWRPRTPDDRPRVEDVLGVASQRASAAE